MASQGGKARLLGRTAAAAAAAAAEAVTLEAELTPVRADPSARHHPQKSPEQPRTSAFQGSESGGEVVHRRRRLARENVKCPLDKTLPSVWAWGRAVNISTVNVSNPD